MLKKRRPARNCRRDERVSCGLAEVCRFDRVKRKRHQFRVVRPQDGFDGYALRRFGPLLIGRYCLSLGRSGGEAQNCIKILARHALRGDLSKGGKPGPAEDIAAMICDDSSHSESACDGRNAKRLFETGVQILIAPDRNPTG